jgi:hypothetical protein
VYESRDRYCKRLLLVELPDSVDVVLSTGHLDDIAVVVDVFRLLLQNEPFEKFGQDPVGRQELDAATVGLLRQDFRYQIGRHFFGLGGQYAKGKLAQFGRRVV